MPDTSRLPGELTLGPVRLRVADASRAGAWLERVLGLRPLAPGAWGSGDGTTLVTLREVPGARAVPQAGLLGIYHYALLLPSRGDLGRFVLHLEAIAERWGSSDHLVSEAIYLRDPDGMTVEVYADRPRETWTRTGDALDMALDPLDRDGLVAAAGTRRWNGAPAGTRMGHLHFFVGDLAAAERHYVRALGFDVTTRRLPGALFVSAGGYHHHVGLNVWASGSPVAGPGDAGLDEWTLRLGSSAALAELAERLAAAGLAADGGAGEVGVEDPWGLRLRAGGPGPDERR